MEQNISFGDYRFDTGSGRLWAGGQEVRLTPKASAVLKALLERAGNPVPKEDLFASVWSGMAVSDDALTSCIQELRKVLADDARQPRFIETRHRRGYAFVAPLCAERVAEPAAPAPTITAIAVLPFADMSPGRDQDYLCEGLAEELINALTRIEGLRVASRTASFQFRSQGADVQAVGRHLGVGTLLEGSVRKADDRLRVTVQLIEVGTGYHRWSEKFDRTLEDVLAIQDDIAEHVVTLLRGDMLSQREKPSQVRPHTGAEAYEYYLRGRQHLHRMTQPDLQKSSELFQQAIALDSGYGPAWGCLAAARATLYEWFGGKQDALSGAEVASRRALELAPGLAESHAARGFVLSLSGCYEEAAKEFEESIRLNPSFFEAYYYYARACFAHGEIARSAELFQKAGEVRREDFQSLMLQGQCLRLLGRKEEATQATREGIRRAEHTLLLNPVDGRALSLGSCALLEEGELERALEWSRRSLELYSEDVGVLINAGCLHARTGRKEEALSLLERVFAKGCGKKDWIEHDPDYDILRDDPRFQRLLEKLN
ncbi:MAG: winged helix-turn-helix domain-containing protein [Acidobacteria bacterium]|nr:winged helix-turn-helix domain-containing protein [Acidobacteriota bacterium]